MKVTFTLNNDSITIDVPPNRVLLTILRDELGLTGAKPGCEVGSCGSCAVVIDGEVQNSCTYAAKKLNGRSVTTIEGLSENGRPNDLQQAFLEHGAVQCGYCIPGIIMAGEALLGNNPSPSRLEIRQALVGNICRCTGYVQIVNAIEKTAQKRANGKETV